ncbi:MAG: hypothetical protein LiPW39_600 [Parcubacteria group bacterium LiPW_39]|nr:MAG: hypothetical protein LiPW39_600 [Parcubacteria group bacterium LiPW_39]
MPSFSTPLPDPGQERFSLVKEFKERAEKILRTSAVYGIAYARLTKLLDQLGISRENHAEHILERLLAKQTITVLLRETDGDNAPKMVSLELRPRRPEERVLVRPEYL